MPNPTQEVTNAQLRADILHLSTQLTDLETSLKTHTAHTLTTFDKHNTKLETLNIRLAVAEEKLKESHNFNHTLTQLEPQVEKNTKFINTLTWRLLGISFSTIGIAVALIKYLGF